MLILTRRIDESIMINENVEVIVLGVKGNQVRLGVNAPRDVPVDRLEIHKNKMAERNLEQHIESDQKAVSS